MFIKMENDVVMEVIRLKQHIKHTSPFFVRLKWNHLKDETNAETKTTLKKSDQNTYINMDN